MAYDEDGELTGEARDLRAALDGADEALRTACHLLTRVPVEDMDPADWSARVAQLPGIVAKLQQVTRTLWDRYGVLDEAWTLRHDSGGDAGRTAGMVQAYLADVLLNLARVQRAADGAHNESARLGHDGPEA